MMAFGDAQNDKSMVEYVGLGVAMGNASDELKAVANEITDTNNNDGIAKAIMKHIEVLNQIKLYLLVLIFQQHLLI